MRVGRFVLNVGYMITNKKIQNALPLSWTIATSSLLAGSVASMLMWVTGIRKAPKLHKGALKVPEPAAERARIPWKRCRFSVDWCC